MDFDKLMFKILSSESFIHYKILHLSSFTIELNINSYSPSLRSSEFKCVSWWLLLNGNKAIFQLYHGENKLIFNEMMMRSALY